MLELSRQNSGSVKKQFDAYKKRNKSKGSRPRDRYPRSLVSLAITE
jgi:hypothetical protein